MNSQGFAAFSFFLGGLQSFPTCPFRGTFAREKSTYKVLVCRSKKPLGPYFDETGRDIAKGGGWQVPMSNAGEAPATKAYSTKSVLTTKGAELLAYHVVDSRHPHRGRILQLRKIHWQDDWPFVGCELR